MPGTVMSRTVLRASRLLSALERQYSFSLASDTHGCCIPMHRCSRCLWLLLWYPLNRVGNVVAIFWVMRKRAVANFYLAAISQFHECGVVSVQSASTDRAWSVCLVCLPHSSGTPADAWKPDLLNSEHFEGSILAGSVSWAMASKFVLARRLVC